MGSRSWGILVLLAALALLLVRLLAPTTARPERARVSTEERNPEPSTAALVAASTDEVSPASATPQRDAREAVALRDTPPSAPIPSEVQRRELCVQLIDAWGAPVAGVSIGLLALQRSEERQRPSSQDERLTDADGRACFPLGLVTRWEGQIEVDLVRVVALLPLAQGPSVELEVGRPVPDELLLTLPPVGALVVHVFDPWHAPARNASVEAVISRADGGSWRASAEVTEGLARFPAVELDTRIELRPTTPDLRARGERIVLDGPSSPGETIEATLRFDTEWPTLKLRALEESGRPLAHATLGMRILHGRLSPQPGNPSTDGAGELRVLFLGQPTSEDLRELLLWTEKPPRLVRLTLPSELGWPTDLGDVILRPTAPGNVPP